VLGSYGLMRLTVRLTILTAVSAVIGGAIVAWAFTSRPAVPAFQHVVPGQRHPAAAASSSPAAQPAYTIKVAGQPGKILAKGAVIADASTGQVLWSRDLTTERPMASVTKVMTALLIIQGGDLNRVLTIPKGVLNYVWKYGADSAGLHPGDKLTVQELLEGLLVTSAADSAYTLASYYGPGIPAFVAKMNAEAARLGMAHTHFTSPDGLPYPTETSTYSTPADLLTLGMAAMKYPLLRQIVDQKFYQIRRGPGHHSYWWNTTNELLGSYPGALGIKTGYTDVAGHCLLFAAQRNGRELMGVVLGSPPTGPAAGAQDAAKLLNWGFSLPPA
jgi:D-alanyl-D-alanine carboxypeptidase (penicillin-binding protein 5/6)